MMTCCSHDVGRRRGEGSSSSRRPRDWRCIPLLLLLLLARFDVTVIAHCSTRQKQCHAAVTSPQLEPGRCVMSQGCRVKSQLRRETVEWIRS